MKLFAVTLLLLGMIPTLAFSELRDATVPRSATMGGMTIIGASGEPQLFRGPEANAAANVATAAAMAHGSKAGEAISAAAQAGMMYRMLMVQGVMDYFQRKEMDKSLELMSKKIEALQKEVKSGKMSQAEYAAIKAAVEEAYKKNSKHESPKDKEVAPNQPQGPSDKMSAQNSFNEGSVTAKSSELQTALQAETDLPRDIAQIGNMPNSELQNGKSPTAEPMASGKASLEGLKPQDRGAMVGMNGMGWMPSPQQAGNTQIHIENASGSSVDAKNRNSGGMSGEDTVFAGGSYLGAEGREEDTFEGSEDLGVPVFKAGGERIGSAQGDSEPITSGWARGLQKLLKPIKIQKNPLSTQLHNEEGIHPLFLLALMAGSIWLGIRLSQKEKKGNVVVPEVILGQEPMPLSRSTEIMLPQRRTDRRFHQRV